MNKILIALYFLLSTFLLVSCSASRSSRVSETDENSLFWKISGNGCIGESYLYGTFHMLCKEDIVFPESMKAAIKNADEVYFEIDMDDMAATTKMMGQMKMSDGQTLNSLFTQEEYEKVERFFKDSMSTGVSALKQYKPFFLISLMYPKLLPCKSKSGVDQEILKMAMQSKRPISGLETIEFQASLFDSIPYKWQAKELLKSIDSFQTNRRAFLKMVESYKAQRLDELMKMTEAETMGSSEFNDVLLNDRNKKWAIQLKDILGQKKIFMAVGAGHLPGPKGVVALLRKEGYQVTPMR